MIGWQLPLLFRIGIGKAEVECWLAPVEVAHELTVALAIALDERAGELTWGIDPVGLCPDVVVGVLVLLLLLRGDEPRMVNGGIADDVVEDDMHTALMSLLEQTAGILVGAIAWCYLVIVAHVVAGIVEGGVEEGIEPDGINAEAFHIVEFADDALQVADAVAIGVAESLWVDLIEYRILGPVGHFRYLILSCDGLCCGR